LSVFLDQGPELTLQLNELGDHGFIALDAMNLQLLATDQDRHVSGLLAGHGELVHDLKLDVLRHPVFPQAGTMDTGCLALQDLHPRQPTTSRSMLANIQG
jgi:hypothetical protein